MGAPKTSKALSMGRCARVWTAVTALMLSSGTFAADIHVTTTAQGVGTGACSLQEAIYSANFKFNIAIDSTPPDHFVPTSCEPGTGNDTIILRAGDVFPMSSVVDDPYNYMGPTATPIVFSNITIEANGARLERAADAPPFRAFAVGSASVDLPGSGHAAGTGQLTIRNAHVKGFMAKGGDGTAGGGGGMGAGGAIYVQGGSLTVDSSTFEGNGAVGGNGGGLEEPGFFTGRGIEGGGGGGFGGNGGHPFHSDKSLLDGWSGGGGGGARGDGGSADANAGGDGGGTVTAGDTFILFTAGIRCGANNGLDTTGDGRDADCFGGGGGGGTDIAGSGGDGGSGSYGGGGGGGGTLKGDGGTSLFGGGGGSSGFQGDGGNAGFGGGGGGGTVNASPGHGGFPFGGEGGFGNGGGGAGLGGAIFNEGGDVTVLNATFVGNFVAAGQGGDSVCDALCAPGANGLDTGGAIFSLNGSLTVRNATIGRNPNGGGGIAVMRLNWLDPYNILFATPPSASFTLTNTIIADNGAGECSVLGETIETANGPIFYPVSAQGTHNLIGSNSTGDAACPDAKPDDPQLASSLQVEAPGSTPTLAIASTSPAVDAADPGTSLDVDQRGVSRPQADGFDIGAYEGVPDYDFSPILPITMVAGGSGAAVLSINSVFKFHDTVNLSATDVPPGFTPSFQPATISAVANGVANGTLTVLVDSTVPAGTYSVTVRGNSPVHETPAVVDVFVTTASVDQSVSALQAAGCIDNPGVSTSITGKLAAAQSAANAGRNQDAINVYAALLYELAAQSGKHVGTCTIDNRTVDGYAVLVADVQALQASASAGLQPNPVVGSVVNPANGPVAEATIAILNGAARTVVATATTDAAGFYYFPHTSALASGSGYTVQVTVPKPYKASTPALQEFGWSGSAIVLQNFVLK